MLLEGWARLLVVFFPYIVRLSKVLWGTPMCGYTSQMLDFYVQASFVRNILRGVIVPCLECVTGESDIRCSARSISSSSCIYLLFVDILLMNSNPSTTIRYQSLTTV